MISDSFYKSKAKDKWEGKMASQEIYNPKMRNSSFNFKMAKTKAGWYSNSSKLPATASASLGAEKPRAVPFNRGRWKPGHVKGAPEPARRLTREQSHDDQQVTCGKLQCCCPLPPRKPGDTRPQSSQSRLWLLSLNSPLTPSSVSQTRITAPYASEMLPCQGCSCTLICMMTNCLETNAPEHKH